MITQLSDLQGMGIGIILSVLIIILSMVGVTSFYRGKRTKR